LALYREILQAAIDPLWARSSVATNPPVLITRTPLDAKKDACGKDGVITVKFWSGFKN
jgi:hypothetical protein